ncbi:YfiT family bacillithiol transferase [Metabacillus sp. RGM 3146]|uniref:YfiT family bacillithiol transferase n=1 Tax=Metabacillus sp. RGM 3146 TaxID=3401092 RepID=UPI003B9A434D
MEDLKYPIGKFKKPEMISAETKKEWIEVIRLLPEKLEKAVERLTEDQLETTYRPFGWTIRQVIHHVADSHMNSFIRFKLALTEDDPAVKMYKEDKWAELPDVLAVDPVFSLQLLKGLHARWVHLLEGLTEEEFKRGFYHPEWKAVIPLDVTLALYAWHSEHHLAHVTNLIKRMGWG